VAVLGVLLANAGSRPQASQGNRTQHVDPPQPVGNLSPNAGHFWTNSSTTVAGGINARALPSKKRCEPTNRPQEASMAAAAGLGLVHLGGEDWATLRLRDGQIYRGGSTTRGVPTRLARYDGPLILMTTAPSTSRSSSAVANGASPR
jgi:hypothetical protein